MPQRSEAAPEDDAVAQYRAYVAAVRAGKPEEVLKLVESFPETSKALLDARIKRDIALEAMKKEMVAQMGPAKTGDDSWAIGGLPYDDVLGNLKGMPSGADVVGILCDAPQAMVGWMVRRNGKWMVPAGLVMGLTPTPQYVEPDPELRQRIIQHDNAMTAGTDAVRKRLKAKEFSKPAEVSYLQKLWTAATS
jgi:hypothetical protein